MFAFFYLGDLVINDDYRLSYTSSVNLARRRAASHSVGVMSLPVGVPAARRALICDPELSRGTLHNLPPTERCLVHLYIVTLSS